MSFVSAMKRRLGAFAWALALCLLIVACGGGGGGSVAGGGIGGTGITNGQITGFGSVIVNGQKFEVEGGTQITIDDDVGQPQTNLQVGMIVTIEHTNFTDGRIRADKIDYQSDVRGPATLSGQTLSVAGQSVIVTDQTCVQTTSDQTECVTGAAALQLLQTIGSADICGNRDASGQLRATRIRKTNSSAVEVSGQLSALNTAAATFTLNGLTVHFGGAQVIGTLANGATVEVKSTQGPVGNVLTATRVKVESGGAPGSTASIEVENLITRFASAQDFDVGTQKVQTTGATVFENGAAADLAANIKVKVRGNLNASNVLVADLVSLRPTIEVEATVTAVNTADSFTLFGTPGVRIKTTALTTFKNVSTPIAAGDNLKISAQQSGSDILATRVERVSSLNKTSLRAPVSAKSSPNFTLLGVTVQTSGSTQYESDIDPSVDTQSEFFAAITPNQSVVKAQGILSGSNTIIADEAEIELPD